MKAGYSELLYFYCSLLTFYRKLVHLNGHETLLLEAQRLVALIGLGTDEDAAGAGAFGARIGHIERVGKGCVLQMPEGGCNIFILHWSKVQAGSQIGIRFLPIGEQRIWACIGSAQSCLHIGHVDTLKAQLGGIVDRQQGFVLVENAIDESMPSVKDWIAHSCGHIAHNTKVLQVPVVGIMGKRDDSVALIV